MALQNYLDFEKPIIDLEQKILEMRKMSDKLDISNEINKLETKVNTLRKEIFENLTPWQIVQLARHPERPYSLDYIYLMTNNFIELHGDRYYGDDKAIVGGFANIDDKSVMIIGQQKGRDTKSNIYRNFGMPNPEGYRKALRLMKLAEKFNKPVITFVDTPGAFPGIEAEERGQAEAIARNLLEMSKLQVPVIVVVIGEGASGGALGIGVGDRVLMLQYCWYSVISPESCSSILWRSWDFKEQAADALKLTSKDMLKFKIIDRIIEEPIGGAHRNHQEAADILKKAILEELEVVSKIKKDKFLDNRIKKFGEMGFWKD
ncbi:MAG: acetyl-CoA carboxylase carboxyltransferase subunit alpha [Ignavibacteria bacterium]|nr:acetyl-CoA carboxylase carboxyltransferase subunit alpha [Ignavibacteria bacterium]